MNLTPLIGVGSWTMVSRPKVTAGVSGASEYVAARAFASLRLLVGTVGKVVAAGEFGDSPNIPVVLFTD